MPFPNESTRFQPGQSGNPGGRPRGRSITARLRDFLDRSEVNGKQVKDGKQVADLVAEAIVDGALAGDFRFIQWMVERVEGQQDIDELRERLESLGAARPDPGGDRSPGGEPPAP